MRTNTITLATVLFGCLALAACGDDGGGGGADTGVIIFADAGSGVDGAIVAACNPVANTGCGPGEKCSKLNQTDTLSRTTCVPDGDVPRDGMCEWGEPGPSTGYDNCEATNYCRNGICREICDSAPDSCSSGNCVQIFNTFDEAEGVGVCAAACDPVAQDCTADGEACYLNTTLGTSSCSRVPEEAVGLNQDDDCYGPDGSDGCFLNGCDEGFAPMLNKGGPDGPGGSVCAAFCRPGVTNINDGSLEDGIAPYTCGARLTPSHECRFIQSFYSNTDLVAADIGMCVPPALWGSCLNYDPADPDNTFVPGCEPLMMMSAKNKAKLKAMQKFKGDLSTLGVQNMSVKKN